MSMRVATRNSCLSPFSKRPSAATKSAERPLVSSTMVALSRKIRKPWLAVYVVRVVCVCVCGVPVVCVINENGEEKREEKNKDQELCLVRA